ncbi:MAG: hypothetical protein ABII00_12065, partial [Elusimicrobiota bacterium]
MDILIRLRLMLWVMVLSLWGLMIYQFLGEERGGTPKMQWVSYRISEQAEPDFPELDTSTRIPYEKLFPERPPADIQSQPAATVVGARTGAKLARIPASVRAPRPTPASRLPQPARASPEG